MLAPAALALNMNSLNGYPPLHLVSDRGEEVYPVATIEPKTSLDLQARPPAPIRQGLELELDPDFPDF